MGNVYLEKRYTEALNLRIQVSNNFASLCPFVGLMKELSSKAIGYKEDALFYVDQLQQLLYAKGLLPFVVGSCKDSPEIDKIEDWYIKSLLWYAWLAYKHVDEDWQWDRTRHIYICLNRE